MTILLFFLTTGVPLSLLVSQSPRINALSEQCLYTLYFLSLRAIILKQDYDIIPCLN